MCSRVHNTLNSQYCANYKRNHTRKTSYYYVNTHNISRLLHTIHTLQSYTVPLHRPLGTTMVIVSKPPFHCVSARPSKLRWNVCSVKRHIPSATVLAVYRN